MTRVNRPQSGPNPTDHQVPDRAAGRTRWGRLPEPLDVDDLRESQPTGDPLDPWTIYDPDREWLIRYGAGGF